MEQEPGVRKDNAMRFSYMAVSGLLFLGANAAWNGLSYLNPLAWFLEWPAVVLAFLCVYSAVRNRGTSSQMLGYMLIVASLSISGVSYYLSVVSPDVQANIHASVNPLSFLVLAIPIGALLPVILQYMGKLKNGSLLPILFFISVIGSMGFLLYSFYSISPAFPTDESVFDMYGAHLFLSGMNPYDPARMSESFSFYNFQFGAFDPITPLTTGGYVQSLTYPALSFLVFIPAILFHLKASLIMLPVLLVPIVIVWYHAWKKTNVHVASFSILPFLGLLLYAYQGGSADTDALWASLLMLSYMVLPKQKTSGLVFGLSLSVKQLPFIITPFLLYYLYKEYGARKTITWALIAAGIFFLINGFFIIQNPEYWFTSMVANEFAPLIGIGFGIPQITFLGIVNIPSIFFTIVMIDFLLVSFIIYVSRYKELKYALFAFPILIFVLNYRLFPQYLYYWMIISILPLLDFMHMQKEGKREEPVTIEIKHHRITVGRNRTKTVFAVIVTFLLASVALAYHEELQRSPGTFVIDSVSISGFNSTGFVNHMNVILSYYGKTNQTQLYFRIFVNGAIINGNMFLWLTKSNFLMENGHTYNLTISPQYSDYSVSPKSSFMLVAYFGNIQGSYFVPGSSK